MSESPSKVPDHYTPLTRDVSPTGIRQPGMHFAPLKHEQDSLNAMKAYPTKPFEFRARQKSREVQKFPFLSYVQYNESFE
jgi:hypothetical protein